MKKENFVFLFLSDVFVKMGAYHAKVSEIICQYFDVFHFKERNVFMKKHFKYF